MTYISETAWPKNKKNFTEIFFSPCPITVLNMNHFEDLLFLFYFKSVLIWHGITQLYKEE